MENNLISKLVNNYFYTQFHYLEMANKKLPKDIKKFCNKRIYERLEFIEEIQFELGNSTSISTNNIISDLNEWYTTSCDIKTPVNRKTDYSTLILIEHISLEICNRIMRKNDNLKTSKTFHNQAIRIQSSILSIIYLAAKYDLEIQ